MCERKRHFFGLKTAYSHHLNKKETVYSAFAEILARICDQVFMEINKTDMGADDTYIMLNTHGKYQILAKCKEICTQTIRDLVKNNVGSVSLCSPSEMPCQREVR